MGDLQAFKKRQVLFYVHMMHQKTFLRNILRIKFKFFKFCNNDRIFPSVGDR